MLMKMSKLSSPGSRSKKKQSKTSSNAKSTHSAKKRTMQVEQSSHSEHDYELRRQIENHYVYDQFGHHRQESAMNCESQASFLKKSLTLFHGRPGEDLDDLIF